MSETPVDQTQISDDIPSAKTMLGRLHEINLEDFDIKKVEEEIRGNRIWINTLTIPVAMLSLVIFTFLGAWISGYLILSFLVSAGIVFFIGKMFEGYDRQVKWDARREAERRVAETEGEFGLLVHFKPFLPTRYRHLIQSLKRRRYLYVDQYIQAVNLLQRKLDHDKFTQAWHIVYPHLKPNTDLDADFNESDSQDQA
ncbi:MAG: hypothetical protein IBX48_09700 [Thiomicrospira sp.]|uniref:hypothetical protein n=1 Tax=Thiomicrospira sp. TaxID=935 RepID=UPI0019FE3B4C|nr:hypothetical protein [Thiomicrospira sp.]MBE0494599.1 hypothetical protein [Thiomicrospira sp.]